MAAYLIRRVAVALGVILALTVFLSIAISLIPGNPAKVLLGPTASPALIAQVRREMGLNHTLPVQAYDFLAGALHGNLGTDFVTGQSVTSQIFGVLPYTLTLAVAGLGLAVLIGVPLGAYSAGRHHSLADRIAGIISISMIGFPAYLSGILLLLVFALKLSLFPSSGASTLSQPGSYAWHLVLPAIAIAIPWIGYITRLVRANMTEALSSRYIAAARSFGLSERTIRYKHALKNALVPTVAVLGVGLGNLMANAIFVEVIFTRPGLGTLLYDAINDRNYPIVRGGVLVIAVFFVLANLLADMSYRLLDARIRIESAPV